MSATRPAGTMVTPSAPAGATGALPSGGAGAPDTPLLGTASPWQIVEYGAERAGEAGDTADAGEQERLPRYAVFYQRRRVVWGLRDRAAAVRWLHRLARPPLPLEPARRA
jgi:hypothetical protein